MPLRSDFPIDAVTPELPDKPPKLPPRRGQSVPLTWVNEAIRSGALRTTAMANLDALREAEIREIGERFEEPEEHPGAKVRRVAFLVVHGMGQQVPFETLSMLGQALVTQDEARKERHNARHGASAGGKPHVSVGRVRLTQGEDAPELSRVEVSFGEDDLPPGVREAVDVHLYESYWAPLTEGQISFLQTVQFLYVAAWNGIRTLFEGKWKAAWAWLQSSSEERVAPGVRDTDGDGASEDGHFDRWMFGRFRNLPIKPGTYWALLGVVLLVTLALVPAVLVFTPWGISLLERLGKDLLPGARHWHWGGRCLAGVVATGFLAAAYWVHYFVVEYVGDVAIYVSSYKVSAFHAIREKILEAARTVAHEIYSAGIADRSQPRYDEVVMVGHSLGSVIVYDALNEAINWDEVECGFTREVVPRTTRLITFGSPLDKTAFLFRTQVSAARNLREALAARQQPLILSYRKFRPRTFRWINIWSPRDYISGRLKYYDIPKDEAQDADNAAYGKRNPVINCTDPEARRPVLAHVQYWENSKLHRVLYRAVWARARKALLMTLST